MELRHIRYFLTVAEEKNFTKAAEKLLIAQPPLSRQIQDLENELGTQLFVRNPHRISLTPEGELFLQYAKQIIELVGRSTEEVKEVKEGLQGTLFIASVEGCAPRLTADWIKAFQDDHPHVQYNLWNGNTDDVVNRMSKGLCELAVTMAPYDNENYEVIPVYEEPWVAVIAGGHPLYASDNAPIRPEELLPYELLIPSRESRKGEINKWFEDCQGEPRIRGRIAHMVNAYELSRAGVGVSIYPASIASVTGGKNVSLRPIEAEGAIASYALIYDKKRPLSHIAEAFVKCVQEHVAG